MPDLCSSLSARFRSSASPGSTGRRSNSVAVRQSCSPVPVAGFVPAMTAAAAAEPTAADHSSGSARHNCSDCSSFGSGPT